MSDNATTETPTSDEPQPAVPVVDAQTSDSVSVPDPANTQELIEQVAPELAASEEDVASSADATAGASPLTDDWSALPESEVKASPKKPKSQAQAASSEESEPADSVNAAEESEHGATARDAADGDQGELPASTVTPSEEVAEPAPENKKKWYAIKVQSGREDTIKAAILRKIAIEGLEDVFSQIMIPVDKVIEKRAVKVKDKKTGESTTQERKVERKVKKFQGYIFAELEFNDRLLYLIRETSGVGDFLKLRPRVNDTPLPEPMTDSEVKQMLGEKVGHETGGAKKVKIEFEKGDRVRIKEGSFKDSEGDVKDVILPKDPTDPPKVIVIVTFWGRPLDVELEYWQVAKV